MGKKEASKGREWEKGRRDVLNQTFWELQKALPNYVEGQTISKKTILIEALACIHQLQHERQQGDVQENQQSELTVLQKWMHHLLEKFHRLLSFLNSSNVKVPSDYVSLEAPPSCINPNLSKLVFEIRKSSAENSSETQRISINKKQKSGGKRKVSPIIGSSSALNHNRTISSLEKDEPVNSVKVIQCQDFKSDFNSSLVANPSIIQSNPLVLQSSPLQMRSQLLFTSNSSSTPLSTTLPVLVSVGGVKTVNPFILVQSNVMARNPSSTRKVVCSDSGSGVITRPIQPRPPNKASKKPKKMPIPSLKQKAVLSHVLPHSTSKKILKRNPQVVSKLSGNLNDNKPAQKGKKSNAKLFFKSASVKATSTFDTSSLKASSMNTAKDDLNVSEKLPSNIASSTEEKSSQIISDVNKENEAHNGINGKLKADGNKASPFLSSSTKESVVIPELLEHEGERAEDTEAEANSILNAAEPQLLNKEKTTKSIIDIGDGSSVKKRLCEVDINTDSVKRQKCSSESCTAGESKPNEDTAPNCNNNCGSTVEGSLPVKPSRSNYSILAICAEQQLMQRTEATEAIVPELQHEEGSSKQHSVECRMEITSHNGITIEKPNDICCSSGKSKDTGSTSPDHYSVWSDKSKFKSDRICPNGNSFSSLPLHNNKNTFIPISDIDNFKAVPDSFDASDGSFGLPMHTSDISNDIFASLQVPSGGQHPESISPTAAFLLAFPLVSTSKATELLSDDAVCENNDSQPGMKTILQIGNLDCDTPVTKCVSEFSSIESSNVVYSSSTIFNHNTVPLAMTKNKPLESTVDVRDFVPKDLEESLSHKCSSNGTLLPLKESSTFVLKNSEATASLKGNQSLISKNIYQPVCSNSNKQSCQSRNESVSVLTISSQLHDSRVQDKPSGTDLSDSILDKTPLKLNESTFLVCEKQGDWMDVPHSSHGSYPDFLTSNAPRSDCAVNYILPPVLMSSSTGGEEPLAVPKSQASSSSTGILSWSTIPLSENVQPSKQTPRLGHFQDMFAPLKSSNRSVDLQQLLPNHSLSASGSSQSQLTSGPASASVPASGPASGPLVSNKLDSVGSDFNQNHQNVKPSEQSLSSDKQIASSNSFVLSGSNSNLKKSFSASERKQIECSSSQVIKVSSSTSENGLFTHQQSNSRQATSQSSSTPIVYTQSEAKQAKTSNIYFDDRTSSQSIKSGMSSGVESHNLKQSINVLNYNHTSVGPELKQSLAVSSYRHESNLSIKENEMIPYHHQTNVPKQLITPSSHYASEDAGSSGPKKHVIHYNIVSESSVSDVSKQSASGNFNLESAASMMHFGSSSANSLPSHQEPYNNKSNGHAAQQVKSHSSQHRQQCGRSSNKEAVANLHRPPVNWMTAPDIRSHQHHSGPSFGNNSNMNSTQGLLYLSDHTKDAESCATVYDQSSNFHCLDITHSGQPLFKGNELHLFGNESMENFHDNSAWSPNKNGGSSMLGNMMIPSTLPTLVGDLALGDNNISRPFLPSYGNDTQSCHKKSVKRSLNASRRVEKVAEETGVAAGHECAGSFLSVSQLVNPGGASKSRTSSVTKESNTSYPGSFSSHDTAVCQSAKPHLSKSVSSNYSTEALLSSNVEQMTQLNHRKRRSHGAHYSNNYVGGGAAAGGGGGGGGGGVVVGGGGGGGGGVSYQNCGTVTHQAQGQQAQFLTDLPPHRTNDYQGTFLHSDGVPSFMLGNTSRAHRNHSYTLQNISDRSSIEDNSHMQRIHHSTGMTETNAVHHTRTSVNNPVNNASASATVSSSSTIMDFGYINMPAAVSQDDVSQTNHPPAPPPPSFLPHHSYPMPMSSQDSLYSAPRLSMHPTPTTPHPHPSQNSNIQSPSATTLTNFHLSTIFPEINEKVIC